MRGRRSGVHKVMSGSTSHLEAKLVETNKQLDMILNKGSGVARETCSYCGEIGYMLLWIVVMDMELEGERRKLVTWVTTIMGKPNQDMTHIPIPTVPSEEIIQFFSWKNNYPNQPYKDLMATLYF